MNTHFDASMKDAAKVVDEAKERAGSAAHRARSAIVDGLHAVAGAATMLRGLGIAEALGLGRRGSRTGWMVVGFGAGFLSGAAVGVLCAPFSGAETRRMIGDRIAAAVRGGDGRAQAQGAPRTAENGERKQAS